MLARVDALEETASSIRPPSTESEKRCVVADLAQTNRRPSGEKTADLTSRAIYNARRA